MPDEPANTCATCRFAENVDVGDITNESVLQCHRRAPIPMPFAQIVEIVEMGHTSGDTDPGDSLWPSVRARDWCGEHEPQTESPDARARALDGQ